MMLHSPYSQTPAKVLESGIIDDLFMSVSNDLIKDRIIQCENGVYTIKIADNIDLFVCKADEFNVIDEGYIFNLHSTSNKQWLSLLFGQASIQHFIKAISGADDYIKEDYTGKTDKANLYHTGEDLLDFNDTILIEEDKVFSVVIADPTQDFMLLRYRHVINTFACNQYYIEKPYGFYDFINKKSQIVALKKYIRYIINNAEAISRLQSRLKNPYNEI